jgi:hypothetical protein
MVNHSNSHSGHGNSEPDISEVAHEILMRKSQEVLAEVQKKPFVQEVAAPALLAGIAIAKAYTAFKKGGYASGKRNRGSSSTRRPRRRRNHAAPETKAA